MQAAYAKFTKSVANLKENTFKYTIIIHHFNHYSLFQWLTTSSQRGKVELLRVDICKPSYKSWIRSSSSQGASAACREFPMRSNRISDGKSSKQRHEGQTATCRVEVCWYRKANCYSSLVCWTQTRGWELHMIPSRLTYVPSATVVTGSMTTGRFSGRDPSLRGHL